MKKLKDLKLDLRQDCLLSEMEMISILGGDDKGISEDNGSCTNNSSKCINNDTCHNNISCSKNYECNGNRYCTGCWTGKPENPSHGSPCRER